MPTRELHTEIEIDAPPEHVWRVLTDFAAYPAWNPLIPEASGELVEGGRLRVRLQVGMPRTVVITPRILRVRPNRELAWKGAAPIKALFRGEHVYEITPSGTGSRLHQWERFTGLLVPVLGTMIDGSTRRGFESMNVALKHEAERTS